MWKRHVFYESRPCSVIITLGDKLYMVPEVVPNTAVSLISTKKFKNVVSQSRRFVLFMVRMKGERKVIAIAKTST